jgi:hypothetical protein
MSLLNTMKRLLDLCERNASVRVTETRKARLSSGGSSTKKKGKELIAHLESLDEGEVKEDKVIIVKGRYGARLSVHASH